MESGVVTCGVAAKNEIAIHYYSLAGASLSETLLNIQVVQWLICKEQQD